MPIHEEPIPTEPVVDEPEGLYWSTFSFIAETADPTQWWEVAVFNSPRGATQAKYNITRGNYKVPDDEFEIIGERTDDGGSVLKVRWVGVGR